MSGTLKSHVVLRKIEYFVFGLLLFTALAPGNALGVPQGLSAAAATPNSVTLTWTAPGDDGSLGQASQYDIRYSLTPITDASWSSATQVSNEPAPQPAGSIETFDVTGLQPSTAYYFAIKTGDEVPNWSALSNVVTKATTAEVTPPSAITTLAATSSTTSSVTLSWTAPGDDGNVGTAAQYDIRYSTATITDANWNSATQATGEPTPLAAGSAQTFVVNGLQANTTYYFAIKTADEVPNWSALSNIASRATSSETTPPSAINSLAATTATANSVTLTWLSVGDDGTFGTASQYDVRYSTDSITAANFNAATQATGEPTPKPAGQNESFTVTGLNQGTKYFFAVKVADEIPNWSGISNVVSRSTVDQTPPAPIQDLSAETGIESGEINLTWTAPGDDGTLGRATEYILKFSQSQITELNWNSAASYAAVPTPLPSGTTESMTMEGLTPGEYYYVAVKACDENSNASPVSNLAYCQAQVEISTDDNDMQVQLLCPSSFVNLHSSKPTLTVANINALSANRYYFEVATDSFFINLVVTSPPVPQEEGATTSWKVDETLKGNQTYFWRARANDFSYSAVAGFSLNPATHAYPNPYNPHLNANVTFTDLPSGAELVLMTVSGSTVRSWSNLSGDDLTWDGTNDSGEPVSSGTYLWFLRGSERNGKLVIVR